MGLGSLSGHARRPLQCDRETPKEWVWRGPVVWPLLNGAALGFGATTRLGFWLWYAIPGGAFLMGDPTVGAAIWGAYGFTRTSSAVVLWYGHAFRSDSDKERWIQRIAGTATTVLMTFLGLSVFLLMGL